MLPRLTFATAANSNSWIGRKGIAQLARLFLSQLGALDQRDVRLNGGASRLNPNLRHGVVISLRYRAMTQHTDSQRPDGQCRKLVV